MQVGSPSFSPNHYSSKELAENLSNDFGSKLKVEEVSFENLPEKEQLQSNEQEPEEREDEGEGEEEEEDEEDFSFVCLNPDGSLISPDEAFSNGQIRPAFPLFNQDLLFADADDGESLLKTVDGSTPLRPPLRKLFVQGRDSTSSPLDLEGPRSELSGRTLREVPPDTCKKSNSTGFSKLWRFRDLAHRSKSDGEDAFVFLNHPSTSKSTAEKAKKNEKAEKKGKAKVNREKVKTKKLKLKERKTAASAAEKHYVEGRAIREGEKRKSYLPYRQDLVGFFTSVNGLSRNVHPF